MRLRALSLAAAAVRNVGVVMGCGLGGLHRLLVPCGGGGGGGATHTERDGVACKFDSLGEAVGRWPKV